MGYTPVTIVNSTPYSAKGEVTYAACRTDTYTTLPDGDTWTSPGSRGACLLTGITATLFTPNGDSIPVDPYESSGTAYSQFAITRKPNKTGFIVTRITLLKEPETDLKDAAEPPKDADEPPKGAVEPLCPSEEQTTSN